MTSLPNTPSCQPGPPTTFYEVLGIETSATDQEVRRAWLRKSLETHPDRKPDDDQAHEVFQNIKEAYETLSNESKRAHYDHCLAMGVDHKIKFPSPGGGGGGFGFGFGFAGPMGGPSGGWSSSGGGYFPWGGGMSGERGGDGPSGDSNDGDQEQDRDRGDGHRIPFGSSGFGRPSGGSGPFPPPPPPHSFGIAPPFGFPFGFPPYPHPMGGMGPGGMGMGMNQHHMHYGRGMGVGYHSSPRGREWGGQHIGMRGGFGVRPSTPSHSGQVQGGEDAVDWADDQPHPGARAFPPHPMFGFGGPGSGPGPGTMFPPRGGPSGGMHSMHSFPPGMNPSNGYVPPRAPFQRPSSPSFRSTSPPIMPSHPRPMSSPPPNVRFGPGPRSPPSTPQRTPFGPSSRGSPQHSQQAFPPRPTPRMPFRPLKPAEMALQNALMMLAQTNAINFQTQVMVGHLLRERFGHQGGGSAGDASARAGNTAGGTPTARTGAQQSASTAAGTGPTLLITNKRHHEGSDSTTEVDVSPPKRPRSVGASTRDDPTSVLDNVEEEQRVLEATGSGRDSSLPSVQALPTATGYHAPEDETARPDAVQRDDLSHADADLLSESNTPIDTHEALDRLLDLLGLSAGQFMSLAKAGKMEDYLAKRKGDDAGELEALLAANTNGVIEEAKAKEMVEEVLNGAEQNFVMSSASTL